MKSFRVHWMGDDEDALIERPRLRAVSRSAPARSRWGVLYATLGIIGALGCLVHAEVHDPSLITLGDAVFGGLLFAALIGWVHSNRIALSRMDEPEAGVGRPRVTIIHSSTHGTHAADRITRLDPDDRIVLPYDFR